MVGEQEVKRLQLGEEKLRKNSICDGLWRMGRTWEGEVETFQEQE